MRGGGTLARRAHRIASGLIVIAAWALVVLDNRLVGAQGDGLTTIHKKGYCALYGECGRNDNGAIPCAANVPASPVDDGLANILAVACPRAWLDIKERGEACCSFGNVVDLYSSVQLSQGLFGACPACFSNFLHLWCTLSCSPDQSLFTNVTKSDPSAIAAGFPGPAADEVDYYFADHFKKAIFDSCKGIKYGVTNQRAMAMFKDPANADEWLEFLGDPKEYSPYQVWFPKSTPPGLEMYDEEIPGCGSAGYECSCADCSEAPYCTIIAPPEPEREDKTLAYGLIGSVYAVVVIALLIYVCLTWRTQDMYVDNNSVAGSHSGVGSYDPPSEREVLISYTTDVHPSRVERCLKQCFQCLGRFIGRNPVLMLFLSLLLIGAFSAGIALLRIETEPQALWTPKGSRSVIEKNDYEAAFGKFYRVETFIVSTTEESESDVTAASGLPGIVTKPNIDLMFEMQEIVADIEVEIEEGSNRTVTLSDVCFKPTGTSCAIESVTQYWQMDKGRWEDKAKEHGSGSKAAQFCFEHYTSTTQPEVTCMSKFLAPIEPKIVLGGYPTDDTFTSYANDTTAFIVTYLLNNVPENEKAAMAWEKAFIEKAKNELSDLAEGANLQLSFLSERSVKDELERESNADAGTVAISYVVMLVYIAVALSSTKRQCNSFWEITVYSRVLLGLGGVLIVVLAVLGALGLCGLFSISASLIIMEVIPFLVLAVGVDNMFILAYEMQAQEPTESLERRMGNALALSGPSIFLAAFSEALAFGLGAMTPVPAVRSFSLCASFAVLLDFILQVTAFAALLVLDTRRIEANRVECLPCIKLPSPKPPIESGYSIAESGTPSQASSPEPPKTLLQKYVSDIHIPLLLNPDTGSAVFRTAVLLVTITLFFLALGLSMSLKGGLEQQVALPKDSYLQDFFSAGLEFLRVGPPVMFVVKGMNMSRQSDDVNNVCAVAGCDPDSMVSQISLASASGRYHLASPAACWVDDFLMWLQLPHCCRFNPMTEEFCPYDPALPDQDGCSPCSVKLGGDSRPTVEQVKKYMPWFMETMPSQFCSRGGKGAYDAYLQHAPNDPTNITGISKGMVTESSFRSYYLPLSGQSDFIGALSDTREFVDSLKTDLDLDIYAYSTFHVFFESYLNVEFQAALLIGTAIFAGFIVGWVFLCSARVSMLVMLCVLMTMVDLMGVMRLWGIQLNGVSVVNLTMGVGIAMEFCVHIAHAFVMVTGSRAGRVAAALEGVGAAVISGITLTKFVGVVVLAFSRTQIFEVYYFRMYLGLVLLGAWHGLLVLPILLAMFGPPSGSMRKNECNGDQARYPNNAHMEDNSHQPLIKNDHAQLD